MIILHKEKNYIFKIKFAFPGQGKELKFGRQRLWATMGYGVAACLSGYMVDLWSQDEIYKNYIPMLIFVLVFICIDLICCIKLKVIVLYIPK